MFSDQDSVHLAYGEANIDFPVKTLKYRYKMCLFKNSFIRVLHLLYIKLVVYELKYFFPQDGNLAMIRKYEDISHGATLVFLYCIVL